MAFLRISNLNHSGPKNDSEKWHSILFGEKDIKSTETSSSQRIRWSFSRMTWEVIKSILVGGFFPPIWKICASQNGNLPQVGMKIKNNWNQHSVLLYTLRSKDFFQSLFCLSDFWATFTDPYHPWDWYIMFTTWAAFKTLMTFHYTDWFIGIIVLAYYNLTPYNWVVCHPFYQTTNQGEMITHLPDFYGKCRQIYHTWILMGEVFPTSCISKKDDEDGRGRFAASPRQVHEV